MPVLPKLYALRTVVAVGHPGRTVPSSLSCPVCGREVGYFQETELVLDSLPECDLVADTVGSYFISEALLAELQSIGAWGYIHQPATISISDDFFRIYSDAAELASRIPELRYFVITGNCDGPWVRNTRGKLCESCGQTRPREQDFEAFVAEMTGQQPPPIRLVFPETWHGEDLFHLSEPGPPLITERVAAILRRTGNLRKRQITDKDKIRRLMPKYAETLEQRDWQVSECVELGPAGWVGLEDTRILEPFED